MRFLFNVNAVDVIELFFIGLEKLVRDLYLPTESGPSWINSQYI